jgi:hypothetical protein
MLDTNRTNKYGTMTSEGFVPHLPYKGIFLPVVLDINLASVRAIMTYQPPLRINDKLCFAKPGGSILRSGVSETEG